ncbi:SDR family NAD(P)-dependent oxidoreductase [Croceicoccus hydrothermalis]|uniref:SDR family NAD(P)-dependent oxidoreductase n=1 Tax=Croceicoccus hydrothermalis TaxID=2867964 RepID=UPI001EFAC147|nr:glucose 1-dehydrogenase [Croceicoccus hydrothermalis]
MTMQLTDNVALVTGGLRGIGRAIVDRLAGAGAHVVLTDLDDEDSEAVGELRAALGDTVRYVRADVTSEDDWRGLHDMVAQGHGRLDILINNAGTDLTGAVETISMQDWRRIMAINVDGVFLGCRTFTPMLSETGTRRKGGSSIVNVSSIMGLVGYGEVSAYNASKGAVRLFTKGLAIEFATKKMPVRANSLHPGFVRTPLTTAGFKRWVEKGVAEKEQDLIDAMNAQTPVGRMAEPDEIAGPALFLASDDASYMTGAELVIDGGWTAQ